MAANDVWQAVLPHLGQALKQRPKSNNAAISKTKTDNLSAQQKDKKGVLTARRKN